MSFKLYQYLDGGRRRVLVAWSTSKQIIEEIATRRRAQGEDVVITL